MNVSRIEEEAPVRHYRHRDQRLVVWLSCIDNSLGLVIQFLQRGIIEGSLTVTPERFHDFRAIVAHLGCLGRLPIERNSSYSTVTPACGDMLLLGRFVDKGFGCNPLIWQRLARDLTMLDELLDDYPKALVRWLRLPKDYSPLTRLVESSPPTLYEQLHRPRKFRPEQERTL